MVDNFWNDLGDMFNLDRNTVTHDIHVEAHKELNVKHTINICEPKYDQLRSALMVGAYEMSRWICGYFITNKEKKDVIVSNEEQFCTLVRDYQNDPCRRLIRLEGNNNGTTTTYVLDPNLVVGSANSTTTANTTTIVIDTTTSGLFQKSQN